MCYGSVCIHLLQEHRACVGMSEVEARYKYTHVARSLKTYGITFFLVKVTLFGTIAVVVVAHHIVSCHVVSFLSL